MTVDTRRLSARQAVLDREAAARDREAAAVERRRAAAMLATACRDDLTGTLTRRAGRERLRTEIARARRAGEPLCLAFLDVDGLKAVNDEHGHKVGDELLAAVGVALRECLRAYDVVIRYGGDEFVCVLPGVTKEVATTAMTRARQRAAGLVAGARFSAGYAMLRDTDQLEDVVRRADADLYRRRRASRANLARQSTNGETPHVPVPDYPTAVVAASVGCGQCAAQIPLAYFSAAADATATRSADCPRCGETTVIRLVRPRSPT